MVNDGNETIVIISTRDISTAQGSTEPYYLSRYFGDRSDLHVFAPLSNEIPSATSHFLPFGGVACTFLLNILMIPYWVVFSYLYKPQVVYCYQNVLTPAHVINFVTEVIIVHDLRSDPYEQAMEFSTFSENHFTFRLLIRISKYSHGYFLPKSDLIVTLSAPLRNSICANYDVPPDMIHILPLGVDVDLFSPDISEDHITQASRQELKIVYVGTIAEFRGLQELTSDLMKLDPHDQERVVLDLYGDGDNAFICDLCEEVSEKGNFSLTWKGRFPHSEIPSILSEYDLGVSPLPPLKSYQVSSPAKIFEYLAAGLPVLASDIIPHRTWLKHEYDAFIVDTEDGSYHEPVLHILENMNMLGDMADNAIKSAARYDWGCRFNNLWVEIEKRR